MRHGKEKGGVNGPVSQVSMRPPAPKPTRPQEIKMTDEELIGSLRLWNRDDAADRIEGLIKISYLQATLLGEAYTQIEVLVKERDEAWKRAAHSEKMWGEALVKSAKIENLKRQTMNLTLLEDQENEDGSVTLTFDLDKEAEGLVKELGLKLLLYCAVAGMSTQEGLEKVLPIDRS